MLRIVGKKGTVKVDEAKDPKENKKSEKRELENKWKDKQMHGQLVRDMTGVDWEKTWQWLRNGDLKEYTEAFDLQSTKTSLRANYVKFHIDKTSESHICRMCG